MATVPLHAASTMGDRILKVDHAGEHGAINVYRAQRWMARWRAPAMVDELDGFLEHERRHRALFWTEMQRRGVRRCRSYHLCGLGGLVLGTLTGLMGARAIATTTIAIESVVLAHLREQIAGLSSSDSAAVATITQIVADEEEHHDRSQSHVRQRNLLDRVIHFIVSASTEMVIWLGMRF